MEENNIYNPLPDNIFCVVMAGGNSIRFWPLSSDSRPKQLLNLVGNGTMIQQTVSRVLPFIPDRNIFVVTSAPQENELRKQISEVCAVPNENVIVEPVGRNTLPCIGLAALYIKKLDQNSVMVVLPSDHFIGNEGRFLELLYHAREIIQQRDCLVTFGIKPGRPETGYGYISLGEKIHSSDGIDVFRAGRFTEKPDKQTADRFVANGNYLWNSGMFVWRTLTLLDMIERFAPDILSELSKIEDVIGTPQEQETIQQAYSRIRSISIDYAIMEKADNVVVIPADIDWSDIGSWATIDSIWEKDANGNACVGQHVGVDTSGCTIYSSKLVATIGLKDMVIVETGKALLVCPKCRAQEVRNIVENLEN